MARFVQGKDGKFAGSIGDGKTAVPSASEVPARSASGSAGRALYDPAEEQMIQTTALFKGGQATFGDSVAECRRHANPDNSTLEAEARIANVTPEEAEDRLRKAGYAEIGSPPQSRRRPAILVYADDQGRTTLRMDGPNKEREWDQFDRAVKKAAGGMFGRQPVRVMMKTSGNVRGGFSGRVHTR